MEVNLKNRKAEPGLRLINMENVAVEQVEWLLYPFIPYGKRRVIEEDNQLYDREMEEKIKELKEEYQKALEKH